jgi:hypothetical protein
MELAFMGEKKDAYKIGVEEVMVNYCFKNPGADKRIY